MLEQPSPTFFEPWTGFVEDNFSMDSGQGDGFEMIQAYYIYYAATDWQERSSGGNVNSRSGCKYRSSFDCPLLTSHQVTWFLTCHGLVSVQVLGTLVLEHIGWICVTKHGFSVGYYNWIIKLYLKAQPHWIY